MMKHLVLIFLAILAFSCSNQNNSKQPIPLVEVIKPEIKDVNLYEEFVGQVYGQVDIPIRARVTGFLEGIHFEEGKTVEKGQMLYSIDSQPYQADVAAQKSKLAEAKTELVRSKNELVRYEELIKTKAVSQSDYEATKAQAEAAQAAVEAAEANVRMAEINLGYCKIYSPINGVIGKTEAKVGEFVGKDPNPVILNTVSHVESVRVLFHLTEKQYLKLAREYQVLNSRPKVDTSEGRLQLLLADGSVHSFAGKIDFINREVDATTGSILVQASFPNPNKILRPGQYAKVRVLYEIEENAILIPQKCVREMQGKYSLQLVTDSSTLQTQSVETGEKINDLITIRSGLTGNEKVVLSLSNLPSGTLVKDTLVSFSSRTSNNDQ
jgi:membrane fusion protein (multidrug efflux system)